MTTTEPRDDVYGPFTVTGDSLEDCERRAQAVAAETLGREPFVWRVAVDDDTVQVTEPEAEGGTWALSVEFRAGSVPDPAHGWQVGDTEALYAPADDSPRAMRCPTRKVTMDTPIPLTLPDAYQASARQQWTARAVCAAVGHDVADPEEQPHPAMRQWQAGRVTADESCTRCGARRWFADGRWGPWRWRPAPPTSRLGRWLWTPLARHQERALRREAARRAAQRR